MFTSDKSIHYIEHPNLGVAWAKAFLEAWNENEVQCLTVSVTHINEEGGVEDDAIRKLLDEELYAAGHQSIHTIANTIFPSSLWNPKEPAEALFRRYVDLLPRLKKRHRANQYGTYFERMIRYGEAHFNQLDYIIQTWRAGNHRRSALQVLTLNPLSDDTNQPRRGFPCLSQVTFTNLRPGDLVVTAYYPMHYLFTRAYGNYLGLMNLGRFMAKEMGLTLRRVNCVAGIAKRDCGKRKTAGLVDSLKQILGT